MVDGPGEDVLFIVHHESTDARRQQAGHGSHIVRFDSMIRDVSARLAEELSGPLDTVALYAQLLLASCNLDETVREGLERIYGEALHTAEVIAGLAAFARGRKPEMVLTSVEDILCKSLRTGIRGVNAGRVEAALEIQPDLPWIMADPDLLQRALAGIIDNACQAMAEAGSVGRIRIRAVEAGGMVRVIFQDNGPGVSEDVLQRLFEPFFTTREAGKGMGLGLTLSQRIIEQHGGSIYAVSAPAGGTTIVIELPHVAG